MFPPHSCGEPQQYCICSNKRGGPTADLVLHIQKCYGQRKRNLPHLLCGDWKLGASQQHQTAMSCKETVEYKGIENMVEAVSDNLVRAVSLGYCDLIRDLE